MQQHNGTLPARERGRKIKLILVLCLTAAAAAPVFLPVLQLVCDRTLYTFNGAGLVFSSMVVNGAVISLPLMMRIFAACAFLLTLAGLAALLAKRGRLAGGLYALGALSWLGVLLTTSTLEKSVGALGVDSVDMSLLAGFGIAVGACVLAALISLWMQGSEIMSESIFLALACVSVGSVVFITVYMLIQGLPGLVEIGPTKFLFGTKWAPTAAEPSYGIAYMVLASVFGTAGAIAIGVPVGLMTAVFLAELAPKWMSTIVRPAVELLAGIPSVIYGFFGMRVLVPFLRRLFPEQTNGESLLAVILILSVMILPTIVNVTENALRSVPVSYREASLALGNTQIGTIFKVVIPAAKSGVLAGVILGVGRAIGETMAIIMVAGNLVNFPRILGAVRPMTSGIAFEMGYASGVHRQALFAIGLVLFVFIMIINITFTYISRKGVQMNEK